MVPYPWCASGKITRAEIFIRLFQRIDQQHGGRYRHIVVQHAVGQHQLPLQIRGVARVRLRIVVGGSVGFRLQQPDPLLIPVVLIIPVLVVAALCDADLDEVRVAEHRSHRSIAAARVPPHADTVQVDPRIALGKFAYTADLIRDGIDANVVEVLVMKGLGPLGIPHAFNLNHGEAKLRERVAVQPGGLKSVRSEGAALRSGIDEIDDRILLRGVKVGGTEEQPVDIGLAVMSLYVKGFGCDPSRGFQACDIAVCQLFDHLHRSHRATT